jgi:hypothetical protein
MDRIGIDQEKENRGKNIDREEDIEGIEGRIYITMDRTEHSIYV